MALPLSQFHFSPSISNPPKTTFYLTQKPTTLFPINPPKSVQISFKPHKLPTILKASQQEENNTTTTNESTTTPPAENTQRDELKDLGAEIKKAMMENEKKETGFWSGVGEEIKEIEWPAFNKVLATTGVVVGVIAGSSVVLLTVNAVLAELSDRVFAGRGVQDFFG